MKKLSILMADLSGYTAWTQRHGAIAAAKLIKEFTLLVNESLCGESILLERIGDQVVIIAEKPEELIETGLKLNAAIIEKKHFLQLHAGIHYGEVVVKDGEIFGSGVNYCSRLAATASAGQILCSEELVFALRNRSNYFFLVKKKTHFKNIPGSQKIIQLVTNRSEEDNLGFIDPVCRMHIEISDKHYRYKSHNTEYHFCSIACMNQFQDRLLYN